MRKKASLKGEAAGAETACFLCSGKGVFKAKYKGIRVGADQFSIAVCSRCGLGRTEPFPDEAWLKRAYSGDYRGDDAKRFVGPIEKIVRALRLGRCKRVERLASAGSLLDVGCGRGDFALLMKERGFKTTGLELNSRIAALGKKIGVDLRALSIEDAGFADGQFDCVTYWHVFEHVRHPERTMRELRRVIRARGALVIAVPNTGSLQARLTGRHWFHLDPPYHLYHYSADNLKSLIGRYGFDVISVKHFSLEFNPYGFLQSILNAVGFERNFLYDFLRGKADKSALTYFYLFITFVLMPLIAPLSLILSIIEAAIRRGGTIEIYAIKNETVKPFNSVIPAKAGIQYLNHIDI